MASQPNEIPIKTPAEAPEEWMTADQGVFLEVGAIHTFLEWGNMLAERATFADQRAFIEKAKEKHLALLAFFVHHEGEKGPTPAAIQACKELLNLGPKDLEQRAKQWQLRK